MLICGLLLSLLSHHTADEAVELSFRRKAGSVAFCLASFLKLECVC